MGSQQGLNARNVSGKTSGSLTNGDGNGNEYGKKTIGLDWQTTILHVHHVHFFAIAAGLPRETT